MNAHKLTLVLLALACASALAAPAVPRRNAGPHVPARITAEQLRELPVDDLREALRACEGVVVDDGLHFRCCCRSDEVRFQVDGVTAASPPATPPAAQSRHAADSAAALAPRRPTFLFGPPARLSIVPLLDAGQRQLSFRVGLPVAGGSLEVYDVQGRRVARSDLGELGAGHHRVALDAGGLASGVYWARVRQVAASATARIVWIR